MKSGVTMAFLYSFGLMQRTKNGEHMLNVAMSESSDRLNCAPSVGVRFLVSEPFFHIEQKKNKSPNEMESKSANNSAFTAFFTFSFSACPKFTGNR
jgi:hypothetical protein